MIIARRVNDYFSEKLDKLNCPPITRAYLVGLFSNYKTAHNDYSNESLTLIFKEARLSCDFIQYQQLGDWIFFCSTIFPEHLNTASKEYYHSLAQLSYFSCYRLLKHQQPVYESLADQFTSLVKETRNIIHNM